MLRLWILILTVAGAAACSSGGNGNDGDGGNGNGNGDGGVNDDGGGPGNPDFGPNVPTPFGGVMFPWQVWDGTVPDVPLSASGKTWYCDPINGKDSYDGTSMTVAGN